MPSLSLVTLVPIYSATFHLQRQRGSKKVGRPSNRDPRLCVPEQKRRTTEILAPNCENMSSCFYDSSHQQCFPHQLTTFRNAYDNEYEHLQTPQSALPTGNPYIFGDASAFSDALALLQQPANLCMNNEQFHVFNPNIRVQTSTPIPAPPAFEARQDSIISSGTAAGDHTWMYQPSMSGSAIQHTQGLKRARSHQRTPSASTVASNGPASPYSQTWSHPQIANTEFAPNSPAYFVDQADVFSKNLPTPTQTPVDYFVLGGYLPSQAAHTGGAHQAMKGFAIDHHNGEDFAPFFAQYSGQNMAGHGNDSPATPQSGAGEGPQNGQHQHTQNGN